jgi:hypothetical protein
MIFRAANKPLFKLHRNSQRNHLFMTEDGLSELFWRAIAAHLTFLQLTGLPSQSEAVKVAVGSSHGHNQ